MSSRGDSSLSEASLRAGSGRRWHRCLFSRPLFGSLSASAQDNLPALFTNSQSSPKAKGTSGISWVFSAG